MNKHQIKLAKKFNFNQAEITKGKQNEINNRKP